MQNSNPTLCILGCGGFIGSHLVERILAKTNWNISGIDKNQVKIEQFLHNPRFTFTNTDISDTTTVHKYIYKSDIVVSLVALCNPALYNTIPLEVIKSNFTQPLDIIEQCHINHKRLIHFSTCEVYGTTVSHNAKAPFNSQTDILTEDTSPLIMGPIHAQRWSYACAKQLLERTIYAYGAEHDLDYTIIRPFNFIGPHMDFLPGIDGDGVPRVIACFMDALLHSKPLMLVDGGKNKRSFTYITDAIDAIMLILANDTTAHQQIFNIGNPDNECTIEELANSMINQFCEMYPHHRCSNPAVTSISSTNFYGKGYEDSDRRIPNITKANTLLGWFPKTKLQNALKPTIEAYFKTFTHAHTEGI